MPHLFARMRDKARAPWIWVLQQQQQADLSLVCCLPHAQDNYKAYAGDASFLAGPTERTKALWSKLEKLICEEIKKVGARGRAAVCNEPWQLAA